LAAATRGVGAVRQAPKPLHPRGSVAVARVSRCDSGRAGVTWLDEPDSDLVLVRRSRAAGLPRGWPDVHGIALRVALKRGGVGDLLLASTGWGPQGRFLLHAGRHPETLFFGSLLPYRSAIGPVVLGALPRTHDSWVLLWARARGPWLPFAQLELGPTLPDETVSFDPVLNQLPGLEQYDALARLRLPAYLAARRSRSARLRPAVR
jgi:hypothetical protein